MNNDKTKELAMREFITKAFEIERKNLVQVQKVQDIKIIDFLAIELERIIEKYED